MKQQTTLQGKRRRNFYLPDTLMEAVEAIAVARETTTTDILRRALEAYVRAWKAKHGQ
jgi:predicted transcriptional regulator